MEHHRLIFDGIPGNSYFSMAKFQELYVELVTARPKLAAAISCGEKLMNIGSPSEITDLPPGILSRSSGDFANFFFQFEAPEFLKRFQGLFNVPGHTVGRPDVPVVRVGMRVLSMGQLFSSAAAHAAHWCLLHRGLVDQPFRLARPSAASQEHLDDLATVRTLAATQDDGMVAWRQIPERMRRNFTKAIPGGTGTGSSRLEGLRVPPSALACEPLTDVSTLKTHEWVRLSITLVGGGGTDGQRSRQCDGETSDKQSANSWQCAPCTAMTSTRSSMGRTRSSWTLRTRWLNRTGF